MKKNAAARKAKAIAKSGRRVRKTDAGISEQRHEDATAKSILKQIRKHTSKKQ